jgi:outer membrane protein OmpA-like peptidoglycan-associated protein
MTLASTPLVHSPYRLPDHDRQAAPPLPHGRLSCRLAGAAALAMALLAAPVAIGNAMAQTAEAVSAAAITVPFDAGSAEIPAGGREIIRAFAATIQPQARSRVLVDAYATAPAGAPAHASRRLALDRALAVRDILADAGIGPTRIELKVHGAATSGPADRVDLDVARAG